MIWFLFCMVVGCLLMMHTLRKIRRAEDRANDREEEPDDDML